MQFGTKIKKNGFEQETNRLRARENSRELVLISAAALFSVYATGIALVSVI